MQQSLFVDSVFSLIFSASILLALAIMVDLIVSTELSLIKRFFIQVITSFDQESEYKKVK